MDLKKRLIEVLTRKYNDEKITITKSELNDLVRKEADKILEQEINKLDQEFIDKISSAIGPQEIKNEPIPENESKELSHDEKIKLANEILNGGKLDE